MQKGIKNIPRFKIKFLKKGKYKYFKYFNSSLIAKYIIARTFGDNKTKYLWGE